MADSGGGGISAVVAILVAGCTPGALAACLWGAWGVRALPMLAEQASVDRALRMAQSDHALPVPAGTATMPSTTITSVVSPSSVRPITMPATMTAAGAGA